MHLFNRRFGRRVSLTAFRGGLLLAFLTLFGLFQLFGGRPLHGFLYYTSFFDQPRSLLKIQFAYDGRNIPTLGQPVRVAELPGLPDGLALLPEEGIAVGCGSVIAIVNPATGAVRTIPAGIQDAYHVMVDATGTNLWAGNGLGLASVPFLQPGGSGAPLPLTDTSIVPEMVAWVDSRTAFYAVDGSFGTVNQTEPSTTETLNRPFGGPTLVADLAAEELFLAGGRWIHQLRLVGGAPRTHSLRRLPPEVDLDHCHVTGRGHFFGANARGGLVFIDYSANGLVAATNHVVHLLPLPPSPGQTLPGTADGVLFLARPPAGGGGDGDGEPGDGGGEEPPPLPETGLRHWWPGDGSGANLTGGPSLAPAGATAFLPGVAGVAFHVAGTNDWWQASPGPEWDLGGQGFTFSAWLWSDGLEPEATLLGNLVPNSAGNHGRWAWEIAGGRLRFFTSRGAGTNGVSVNGPSFLPLARRWYHLALGRQGSQFRFYVNGTLRASVTNAVDIAPQVGPLIVGALSAGARLDEIQWYDRSLATNEVYALYRAGAGLPKEPVVRLLPPLHAGDELQLKVTTLPGVPMVLEHSANLQSWEPFGDGWRSGQPTVVLSSAPERRFFRLRRQP